MSSKITIIVNTYDKFEDCWDPFFILFSKFWPTCNYTIVLTTYNKQYEFRNLNIISTQVENHFNYEPAWSETLMFTLEKYVKSDLVLLLLDDFFISNNVDEITIKKCIEIMTEKNYSNITLTNHDSSRISHRTDCSLLNKIDDKSPYRITTSPSLWKKSSLKKYLRADESIWMFEIFGSRRSYRIKDSFYKVNESEISDGFGEVIPYFQGVDDTGIVKGKWQVGIDKLFESSGIEVDYNKRGFYTRLPSLINKYYLFKKLIKNPNIFIRKLIGR